MNKYYEQIMEIPGAEDLKKIVNRWQVLSDNITNTPRSGTIVLPDMLWVSKPGAGNVRTLKLIAEFLNAQGNLMEFYGDVKYFEFKLNYCPPDKYFTEIQRLMDVVSSAAGFRNEFKGIVFIDIDEWLGHSDEKHFIEFIEYLMINTDKWLVILSVSGRQKDKVRTMEALLTTFLRIEKVVFLQTPTADLFKRVEGFLASYGISLDEEAGRLICETIETLQKNKYYDDDRTITMLCQDIVYDVFSVSGASTPVLDAGTLADFSADSDYVKRTVFNIEQIGRIGLLHRGE